MREGERERERERERKKEREKKKERARGTRTKKTVGDACRQIIEIGFVKILSTSIWCHLVAIRMEESACPVEV